MLETLRWNEIPGTLCATGILPRMYLSEEYPATWSPDPVFAYPSLGDTDSNLLRYLMGLYVTNEIFFRSFSFPCIVDQ